MRKKKNIMPCAFAMIVLASCASQPRPARVRISQPQMRDRDTKNDTASFSLPKQIAWVDEKGEQHIVTRAEKDSVTGEDITTVELGGITVMARSKQVAERNGKINLDFLVTVPSELISNKWQLQLTPVAYKKKNDSILLDKIFLSGADFAKMQKKGFLRYQAFMNSIIPDSAYLTHMFDERGYRKAMAELEEEYFQAWKHEVIEKEKWIDWSDRTNARFALFNYIMERNRTSIEGYNSILEKLPAYWMRRELDSRYLPGKWKMFVDENYRIRTKSITPEDSTEIVRKFTDYKRIAENRKRKEQLGEMYDRYVRFPYQAARLDTIIRKGGSFVYYYKQELPANEDLRKIDLTLNGLILAKNESRTQLPPSDTITYFVSSMVQFLDHTPRYRKKVITRKDERQITAYVNYKAASTAFDEQLGNNASEIGKVFETINRINFTGEYLIDSIHMTATSSPEGSASMNYNLSRLRAAGLKKYLAARTDDREGVDSLFRPKWTGEDWEKLRTLISGDDSLVHKRELLGMFGISNPDLRENGMRKYREDYSRIREKFYPLLRAVEFKFHLHRRDMIRDTVIVPVIDSTYMRAVQMIEDRQYKEALSILDGNYEGDFNTAVCLMSLGYDRRALEIMLGQEDTSNRNYLLAILYCRLGREREALRSFIKSCDQDGAKIWRGRLDPEINKLIITYNLYKDEY